ncbi:MAG: hypothetical protein H0V92_05875 [Pseudonocardiales bacterium]|nr:hypothetical protein [Pseudonocardiales bacterium]
MSIIPAKNVALDLYEGSTLDRTFTFYTDAARTLLKDLTGYTAALQVRATYASGSALLSVVNGALADPPTSDVLVMGGVAGTVRLYVRDETMAALDVGSFTEVRDGDDLTYQGVWDLEMTNPAGETSRYLMGPAYFSQEATR